MDTLKPAAKKPEEDTKASDSKAPISQDKAVILKELLKKFQKFRKPRITKKYKNSSALLLCTVIYLRVNILQRIVNLFKPLI